MVKETHQDRLNAEQDPIAITRTICEFNLYRPIDIPREQAPKAIKNESFLDELENNISDFAPLDDRGEHSFELRRNPQLLNAVKSFAGWGHQLPELKSAHDFAEQEQEARKRIADKWVELRHLRNALKNILAGGVSALSHNERDSLTHAASLVDLLAQGAESWGRHDIAMATDADFLKRARQIVVTLHHSKGDEESALQAARMKDRTINEGNEHIQKSYYLRDEVIPLFRELAQALHISFNEPSKGRG